MKSFSGGSFLGNSFLGRQLIAIRKELPRDRSLGNNLLQDIKSFLGDSLL
jgi:hypothetical protein